MKHFNKELGQNQPSVIAVFKDHSQIEKILTELREQHFENSDISLLMATRNDLQDIADTTNASVGARTGMFTGIAAGGILGWLTSANLLTIPGAGSFIVAGPLISAVSGAAIGGAIGAISGALIGYGVTERDLRKIEKHIIDKGVVVSIHVSEPKRILIAKHILVTNGAMKIYNPILVTNPRTFLKRRSLSNRMHEI